MPLNATSPAMIPDQPIPAEWIDGNPVLLVIDVQEGRFAPPPPQ